MSKILIFAEANPQGLRRSSLELLHFASAAGAEVSVLVTGSHGKDLAADLGKNGAQKVLVAGDAQLDMYQPEAYAATLEAAIQQIKPDVVLGSASALGKDLFPRVAARLDTSVISDGVEIKLAGTQVEVKKPLFSGKCFAQAQFASGKLQMVLMRANQLPLLATPNSKTPEVTELKVPPVDLKAKIKSLIQATGNKMDLTEANIIVSGGRGLKDPKNFSLLEDLAKPLNATVGASRAVVDAGWASHSMQVGQTGKTVAPSLYFAVGISGAIQHLAGMSGSKVVVAINNDPNAPIFQKATYGIVGDLFQILPLLTEEFKTVLNKG